jgi:hypothetical protein
MMFIAALMGKYADAANRQKHICWTRMQMRYITGNLPNTGWHHSTWLLIGTQHCSDEGLGISTLAAESTDELTQACSAAHTSYDAWVIGQVQRSLHVCLCTTPKSQSSSCLSCCCQQCS